MIHFEKLILKDAPHSSVRYAQVESINEEQWFEAVRIWIEENHLKADEELSPTLFAFDLYKRKLKTDDFIPSIFCGYAQSEYLDIEWQAVLDIVHRPIGHDYAFHPIYIYHVSELP